MRDQKTTRPGRDNVCEELKSSEYADILEKPHHVSPKRTPMELSARAAQFAPFAALSGSDFPVTVNPAKTSVPEQKA